MALVKGITRQVIVVQSPDRKLFEQAIFILRENAEGITDEMLLREARQAARSKKRRPLTGPVWACGGALATGIVWLLSVMF